jgi:LuxR family maltose regulon positive regulatory protein
MLVDQRELRQMHSDTSESSETTPTEKVEMKPGVLPEPLSQRELEVLALIHEGHANKEIASKMKVAPATVKAHIRNLYGKLGVGRRTEALARARDLGLLEA